MRSFVKGLLLVAIVAGVMVTLSDLPAMAFADRADTSYSATDIDSIIQSGIPGDGLEGTDDTNTGRLWVTYVKTNGQKTSAQKTGTQYDTYTSDTVLGVPTAILSIQCIYDNDSRSRTFSSGGLQRMPRWVGNNTGMNKMPRDTQWVLPESGETVPLADSLAVVIIETQDTGSVLLKIVNTSNYACSFVLLINFPDSDLIIIPRVYADTTRFENPQLGATWIGAASARRDDFIVSVGQHPDTGLGLDNRNNDTISTTGTVVRVPAHLTDVLLAEEAETQLYVRFGADTTAQARDSLPCVITVVGDTEYSAIQWGGRRHTRIYTDSGYYGDNDTHYGEGGSYSNVSVFVLVATAIVRVKKTDSVFAPMGYRMAVAGPIGTLADSRARARDTVPGATIIYEITYDNDGNRRADTIDIIDFLDSSVDFLADTFNDQYESTYLNSGVDTRMTHARQSGNQDSYVYVSFSTRTAPNTFGDSNINFNSFGVPQGAIETIAAVRIRWNPSTGNNAALKRDQVDEPSGNSQFTWDPLDSVDNCTITTAATSDSGDCGRIRFQVVIR